ncbi:MAG: hypothetical protein LBB62_06220 [Proteiniphilum sp.]|nr:hypothetical protein [Proteiniphilum sp.]
MRKKILIGTPVTDSLAYKNYCLENYLSMLQELKSDKTKLNFMIILECIQQDAAYYIDKYAGRDFRIELQDSQSDIPERMVACRNRMREIVLEEGYDYLLFLEQDILPDRRIPDLLLKHGKPVCSALYFNIVRKGNPSVSYPGYNPMIWRYEDDTIVTPLFEELFPPALMKFDGCGLGCVLIHRHVLEKIAFRYEKDKPYFEEFYFMHDCKQHAIDIFVDTGLICRHYTRKGYET